MFHFSTEHFYTFTYNITAMIPIQNPKPLTLTRPWLKYNLSKFLTDHFYSSYTSQFVIQF